MILYRNYDLKIIRELLKEIGRHRYEQALENMKVTQKPLGMEGWRDGIWRPANIT